MSGPSAPNWAGNTRFIGPTGPAGQNGAAGGLTLFLDSATSTSVPTIGSLLLAPVLTAQTTISFTATNSTVLIAKFPSAVGAIVEETITPGAWDLNIYASASSLTNAPLFYWSLYQVDADGSSNPVLIADGSANEQVITSLTATLQTQSLNIPAVLLPAGKRIACYLYARYRSGSRTATFSFRTGSQSFLGTTIIDSAQNWSEYPAVSHVNLQQYNISNVQTLFSSIISNSSNINTATLNSTTISNSGVINSATISNSGDITNLSNISTSTISAVGGSFTTLSGTLTGNVTGNLTGNVVGNISNTNLTVSGQFSINEVADVGSAVSNYGSYGTVNISGKGGLGSSVNITADSATPLNPALTSSQLTAEAKGNYGVFVITPPDPYLGYVPRGGLVSIIARQGLTPTPPATVTSALFANGEIDLTAYSYGSVPGLIKLISGANAMYAGAVTPITGVIGYNYVFGQFGNNITAGLPPGGIPTVPGENYIYGLNGTVVDNGLYTDTIYNKFGGDLNLNGRTCNVGITASNSNATISLTASNTGANITLTSPTIGIAGTMNMSNNAISNCASISASNSLTLNANPFSNIILNANETVVDGNMNLCNHILFNVSNVQANSNLVLSSTTGGNIVLSNIGFLNMSGFSISNINTLAGCNVTVTTTGNLTLSSTNQVICSNDLNMSNKDIINVANIFATSGSNLTISNDDHFITLPPPDITYATGGTITQSGGRTFHTFTADGTFSLLVAVGTIEVMAVGGGGGGGGASGGGGGAGNMVVVTGALAVANYTVTIGQGGIGGTDITPGGSGSQSRFTGAGGSINIRALGGGGGATDGVAAGANGGCGGGGSAGAASAGGTAGLGITTGMTSVVNVAFDGGSNPNPGNTGPAGSGGGGTSSIGVNVSGITPADGGDGGTATLYYGTYYGGGGGGSAAPTGAYGSPTKGRGGGTAPPTSGGNGSLGATSTQAQVGVANTGGGGGGGEDSFGGYPGAAGGSGIVIVSYDSPTTPQMTLNSIHEILMDAPFVTVNNDLTINGTTNLNLVNISNLTADTLAVSSNATFNGTTTVSATGKLVGQNAKPIAITTGVATGFWNPSGSIGTVTASGAAGFSNVDNPSGFAVADFNAYMSLLSFNNLNATDFYLSDQRIQQNSSGTYWVADCDAIAYNPNVYLSNQNVQWIVNAMFIPKSLSS
jgi:hypothetical protein